ncbi:5-oxoprolinase subunit PxpA [Nocardioides bigeumensis]|uniref:5-oxoprolinase subunit PxpA n=1 Tax=Nocardioides bigeumensis TaxID=433657 RepID=A0ABP5JGG3_9ACTN
MGSTVDLVADIGESFGSWTMGDDAHILRTLTSANIACGFHAGDPRTMKRSIELCLEHDVSIGAHPSFPDLVGFGRRAMELSREEIATDVIYQVGALQAFARTAGTEVRHVSPHGRLGTLVGTDPHYAKGVADAIEQIAANGPTLTLLTMTGELEREAHARGLPVVVYGLVDRNLEDDGTLVSRRDPEALVHDEDALVERALSMVLDGSVTSRHGKRVEVTCDSLLMHGDHPSSVRTAERIRAALEEAGVEIAPFARPTAG